MAASWTFQYFFGDDEATIVHDRVSACLHFVCLSGESLEQKISFLIGEPKPSKQKSSKKKSKQNSLSKKRKADDEWLDQQVHLAQIEQVELDNKRREKLEKSLKKMLPVIEKIVNRKSKRESVNAIKEHGSAVVMVKIVLAQMLADWAMDTRKLLGTHRECRAALDWDIENSSGWWRSVVFKVRTTAQLKFTKIVLSLAFESKKDDFEWNFSHTYNGCRWDVCQQVRSFKLKWTLHLCVSTSVDLFKDPSIIPFEIGKIMIPKNVDYKIHFQIGHCQILMPVTDGTLVIRELIQTLIERKFTCDEDKQFSQKLSDFLDRFSDENDRFNFMCSCSVDGIILMAGISPDYEHYSLFHRYIFSKIRCGRRAHKLVTRITSFILDPVTSMRVHPLISLAGFGGIPDWLPMTKVPVRSIIHFCS